MGLSASQGRMLLLTARKNDLEFRAQQISQARLVLASELEKVSKEYEDAVSNRSMTIQLIGGTDQGKTKTDYNLTYTALTSSACKYPEISGIKAGSAGENFATYFGQTTSSIFRLKDANGYTVISSLDEIPNVSATDAKLIKNSDGTTSINNATYIAKKTYTGKSAALSDDYKEKLTISKSSEGEINCSEQEPAYVLDKSGVLTKITDKSQLANCQTGVDGNGAATYTIVNAVDGADVNLSELADAKTQVANMTTSAYTYSQETVDENCTITKGVNNVYTLVLGGIEYHYLLDESLQETTNISSEGSPNYLQECLRNGLYYIEQYNMNADEGAEEADKWQKNSYDTISAIYDQNYTADDAAAKAKYDRLQNEIETKDKKLQMELDNIETQRSAVNTEMDSVQKVIDDNIDKTFKTFA